MTMVAPQQSRPWWPRIRWCLGLLLGTIILFVLFHDRNELSGTSTVLSNARPLWAVVALLSETLSLASFTLLQRRILHVGSVDISPWTFFPVSLANNSIANTLPGAPAFAGAFRFGQYRRIGAGASLAGWTVLTQLLAATTGLAIIVLAGIVVAASGGIHQNILATTLVAFVVVLILGTLLVRRHLLVNTLASIIRLVQRITGHPRGNVKESIDQVLAIMRTLHLSLRDQSEILAWAITTWLFDAGCLVASFACVRGAVPWYGLLLAYAVAQLVSALPLVPGGIGIVEGSLTVVLVAYGAHRAFALSAVIVYRLISFWLFVLVGWICFFFLMRAAQRKTPVPPNNDELTLAP
jgi:hypothetical protein